MTTLSPSNNRVPSDIKHIHLIGICGTGMAALAGMLKSSGYKITGSDANVYPPMSHFLEDLQIQVHQGYGEQNLQPVPDLVIVGNVATPVNPEAIALGKTDIAYLSFPQALASFFIESRTSLVISGTHGKTTTCSLLASALHSAGLDPTFMIGGIVKEFNTNFRLGGGKYFIAEGDEYDTAFFDKESKFLHYQPQIAVITSIEFDHADIFTDLNHIKDAFRKFVQLIPPDGLLIANFDDPNVRDVIQSASCRVESYGLDRSYNWSLEKIITKDGVSTFDILNKGKFWSQMNVRMTGRHNCLNSLAVCVIMAQLNVPAQTINQGLFSFMGVKRRQEVKGHLKGVTVIDDFAHHPTAVRETLKALKEGYPYRRLIAVFEPRTNSSRRSIFQKDYVESFDSADVILLREPIAIEGLTKEQLFSSALLAADLQTEKNAVASAFSSTDDILSHLQTIVTEGDVIAILSNGGFDNIHARLLGLLESL